MGELSEEIKHRSDRITRALSLIDLRLRHVSADLLLPAPALDLEVWPSVEPQMTRLEEYVIYDVTYKVSGTDANKREAIKMKAIFSLIFSVISKDVTEEDLAAFGAIGALSIVHPYVRELLHNVTARMGLPPLLLDVMPPEPTPNNNGAY